jgi:FkbH-like protein
MIDTSNLRQSIEEEIRLKLWGLAHQHLSQLWHLAPTMATASYLLNCWSRFQGKVPMVPYRLTLLRSFTVEPLIPLLRAGAFAGAIDLTVTIGDFNTYAQEILSPGSKLYQSNPDAVILAIQTRDLAPELWESFSYLSNQQIGIAVERAIQTCRDYIQTFRAHSQAHLILHNLEEPVTPSLGLLDGRMATSQTAAIQAINQGLRAMQDEYAGVFVLDYNALIARQGRRQWSDQRHWASVKLPVASNNLIHLAKEWLRFIHPLSGKICKLLITDLDNTLWRGVLGEDGSEGIRCGSDAQGFGYRKLQQMMLELRQRGVLLAICSKNNEAEAIETLEKHTDMLLRPHHFTAWRINWQDKGQNIGEIAAEMNLGIDAIAYVDDNPVELERVRAALPEVCIIALPEDAGEYSEALREHPLFERLTLSEEDKERQRYYTQQRQRLEARGAITSLEDFYRALKQEVAIAQLCPESAERIAQLTQKTNQFNLTTRRYSKQQILNMASSPGWKVFGVRVKDRFGDNGLSGVVITQDVNGVCEIDTLLLSCRVIGRTVETALLWFLIERARSLNLKRLQGTFLPTKKNVVAKDFYPAHGFHLLAKRGDASFWEIDPEAAPLVCPEWIQLTVVEGESS